MTVAIEKSIVLSNSNSKVFI